jgi:toxin YoeB
MPVSWADRAWEDYQYWAVADRNMLIKINTLLEDISVRPFVGLGKPEPLKYNWRGW